jgi:predicted membrane channel-forming protein YqfA (hemolysin III family)
MSMPFAIIGIFLMLFQKPVFNIESFMFFILVVLVFILSLYYTFKYSVFERFKTLNKEIQEVENIEKE